MAATWLLLLSSLFVAYQVTAAKDLGKYKFTQKYFQLYDLWMDIIFFNSSILYSKNYSK